MAEGGGIDRRRGWDGLRNPASSPPPVQPPPRRSSSKKSGGALVFRGILAAATIAAIVLAVLYFIDRDDAPPVGREPIDVSREDIRDARKKIKDASRAASEEACARLAEDYAVWDDYLDKQTRRKLKALMTKCRVQATTPAPAAP